jgi:hypothetical protein
MTTRTFLERLPGAVITTALVLLLGTWAMVASPRVRALMLPAAPAVYAPGDAFEPIAFDTSASSRTLVVVSGPNCGASEASHAFLAEAVSAARAAGIAVWLYTPEAADPGIGPYATRLGIAADRIRAIDTAATKIRVMPTLALLDQNAAVLNFWEHAPTAVTGPAILQTLRADLRR